MEMSPLSNPVPHDFEDTVFTSVVLPSSVFEAQGSSRMAKTVFEAVGRSSEIYDPHVTTDSRLEKRDEQQDCCSKARTMFVTRWTQFKFTVQLVYR